MYTAAILGTDGDLMTVVSHPPTPPRDVAKGSIANATTNSKSDADISGAPPATPGDSPSQSTESRAISQEKSAKRVDFSPWTHFIRPQMSINLEHEAIEQPRLLPPSKDCRSIKSILKRNEYADDHSTTDTSANNIRDLPTMLDDALRELATPARSSRNDAYFTLNGYLKAHEDILETRAIQDNIGRLLHFARRDLLARSSDSANLDSQIVSQALKLVAFLVWHPTLVDALSEDFRVFILDRCIDVLEDQNVSKALANSHMNLLATQGFEKLMTRDRTQRLLKALNNLPSRVRGNGSIGQRLLIYQRLLLQSPSWLTGLVDLWIDHLFSAMLSTIKEIRSRAIGFGIRVGLDLGMAGSISQAVLNILNRTSPEGKKFLDLVQSRLCSMLAVKEEAVHVPQIWSVVIVCLRSRPRQLEHWEHMKTWLSLIQKCFNSSDTQVKFQANVAWNRLIFAISPDTSTGPSMKQMLLTPIISQLTRKPGDRNSQRARQIAYASYCTLLYYAFRPGASSDQIDEYWKAYVSNVLALGTTVDRSGMQYADRILTSLFGNTRQISWSANRANEQGPVKPEELPGINSKWVRQRIVKILDTFETIFTVGDQYQNSDGSGLMLEAWKASMQALANASTQEVKTSMESMTAIAQVMNFLRRISGEISRLEPKLNNTGHYAMIFAATDSIGSIAFTERRVVQTPDGEFHAIEAASSRSPRQPGLLASPIAHILNLILENASSYPTTSQSLDDAVRKSFQVILHPAVSKGSRLRNLRDLALCVFPSKTTLPEFKATISRSITEALSSSTLLEPIPSDSPGPAAHDYGEVVNILKEVGQQNIEDAFQSWRTAVKHVFHHMQRNIGLEATILALVEPLASTYAGCDASSLDAVAFTYASALIDIASWNFVNDTRNFPQPHPEIVPTITKLIHQTQAFYRVVDKLLFIMYHESHLLFSDHAKLFIVALTCLLQRCPLTDITNLLENIQGGLAALIEDNQGMLRYSADAAGQTSAAIYELWIAIRQKIQELPKHDYATLHAIERIVRACLSSRHRPIVGHAIVLWNSTFGLQGFQEYPNPLLPVLQCLKSVANLTVPNLKYDQLGTEAPSMRCADLDDIGHAEISLTEHVSFNLQGYVMGLPQQPENASDSLDERLLEFNSSQRSSHSHAHRFRREPKSTVLSRPHPTDSQIPFQAIESSISKVRVNPLMLTNRQQEVSERQLGQTTTDFAGLRSLGIRECSDDFNELPKLELKNKPSTPAVEERPLSPNDSVTSHMELDFLGSSPTPSRTRNVTPEGPTIVEQNFNAVNLNDEVAQVACTIVSNAELSALNRDGRATTDSEVDQTLEAHGRQKRERLLSRSSNLDHRPMQKHPEQENLQQKMQVDETVFMERPEAESGIEAQHQANSLNQALQMDRLKASVEIDTDDGSQYSNVLLSDDGSSPIQSDDAYRHKSLSQEEQLSAQIAHEMERAMSQPATEFQQSASLATSVCTKSKKRKRPSASPSTYLSPRKKRLPRKLVQVVIETAPPAPVDEEILDCIVLEPFQSVASHARKTTRKAKVELQNKPERPVGDVEAPARTPRGRRLPSWVSRMIPGRTGPTANSCGNISEDHPDNHRTVSAPTELASTDPTRDLQSTSSNTAMPDKSDLVIMSDAGDETSIDQQSPYQIGSTDPLRDIEALTTSPGQDRSPSGMDMVATLKQLLTDARNVTFQPGEATEMRSIWLALGREIL